MFTTTIRASPLRRAQPTSPIVARLVKLGADFRALVNLLVGKFVKLLPKVLMSFLHVASGAEDVDY